MEPDSPDIAEFSVDIVPQFGRIPTQHEDGDYYSLSPLDQVRFKAFCKGEVSTKAWRCNFPMKFPMKYTIS